MFRYLLSLAVLVTATAAYALTPAPVAVSQLGSITVTAPSGTPQTLDNTLAPVVLIGSQTLRSFGNAGIGSVLRFHAGLDITSNGGPGQPTSLFLRGTGSAANLVLVDGIRVTDGVNGGAPFANLLASGIGRVEVVEAPRSALYGADAIGGVVSITLRQPPRKGFDAGTNVSGGHYSSRGFGAHAGGGNGTFFGGADFNWFETAGFPTKTASNQASAYRNQSFHAEFGAQNTPSEAYATFWRSTGTTDYLNFTLDPVSDDYTDRVASIHLASQVSPVWHSRVILGQFFDGIEEVPNPANPPGFTHTWRNSLDWRNDVKVGSHQLVSAGLFLAHQHANALSFGTGYESITRTRAVYAQDQIHFGAHRIVLAARESRFTSFGNQFTWNADYGFRFAHAWRFTAGAGTGFLAPTVTDRFGVGGNPDLEPEYAHSLNAGLYRRLDDHALIGLNLYRNHVANLITFESTPTGGREQNIGSATITGVNLTAHLVYGPWHIEPAVNFQRPLNDETDGYLPRRIRKSATLNLSYGRGRWRIGAHFLAAGPTKDSDFDSLTNAGYLLTDLTAGFQFAPHWRVDARIENLFDVRYATAAGFATAGRGLYLALSYDVK